MAQIYRQNGSIYDASNNQKIPDVATLQKNYAGATEIKAPTIPFGATKISGPSGLQGLKESDIYRSGADIYKLPSSVSSDVFNTPSATIKPVEQSFTDTKPYVAGLDTTTKGLESLINTALAPTPQEKNISPITSKITELTGQFEQKPVDYQTELDKYGFKTNVQDLQNLNTQIASKKAEYDSAIQSQEGRAGLAGSIYGRQSLLARQSAVELGGLSSMAQALQGNVQMAQNIADKTIAIKYEPVEQEIANQKFQLEQVYSQLTRDEQKKADALKITLDERQILIDTEKETEANINKIMTAAAQNGADTTTLQKIMSAKNVNQAVINAGQYLAEAQSGQPTEIGDNLYYDPSTQSVVTGEQLVSGVVIPKSSRLAYVNNNPGNLRFVGQAGATQGEGGFARFESPEAGYEALKNQISLDASRGLTLEKFINKYAPPSENNTGLYIQQAVSSLGVDKSTKLSDINLDAIAQFMANKESGTKISSTPSNITNALDVILGSGKFTKDQTKMIKNSITNGEDPLTVIKNQAKNIMSSSDSTTLSGYETAKQQLLDMDSLLKQYYEAGGKTSLFKGTMEKTINRLGEVDDPKLVAIATNIASTIQAYRKAISGTAFSAQEKQDIDSVFPGINKSSGLNEAIIKGRIQSIDSTVDASYRNVLGSAYDQLKPASITENKNQEVTVNKQDEDYADLALKNIEEPAKKSAFVSWYNFVKDSIKKGFSK